MTGDMSLTGDFDGDGTTDLGVFRPATGQWFLLYSSRGFDPAQFGYFAWGTTGDVPLLDDFDGDGRTDVTVYRPSTGQWFIRFSRDGPPTERAVSDCFQGDFPGDATEFHSRATGADSWRPQEAVMEAPPWTSVHRWTPCTCSSGRSSRPVRMDGRVET